MSELNEIIDKLKEIKPVIEKEYSVEEVGIFGSYVRGEQTETSDIDIMVALKQGHAVGLIEFAGLKEFLSNILGLQVDLITKKGIKPALKKYILNEVIYL
jgi:predicted nucleotidyltransferase